MSNGRDELFASDYAEALADLKMNSKPLISALTEVAAEHQATDADTVVELVEHVLETAPALEKLPVLYLLDSICKNCQGNYLAKFGAILPKAFQTVYAADARNRPQLDKLKATWADYFAPAVLQKVNAAVESQLRLEQEQQHHQPQQSQLPYQQQHQQPRQQVPSDPRNVPTSQPASSGSYLFGRVMPTAGTGVELPIAAAAPSMMSPGATVGPDPYAAVMMPSTGPSLTGHAQHLLERLSHAIGKATVSGQKVLARQLVDHQKMLGDAAPGPPLIAAMQHAANILQFAETALAQQLQRQQQQQQQQRQFSGAPFSQTNPYGLPPDHHPHSQRQQQHQQQHHQRAGVDNRSGRTRDRDRDRRDRGRDRDRNSREEQDRRRPAHSASSSSSFSNASATSKKLATVIDQDVDRDRQPGVFTAKFLKMAQAGAVARLYDRSMQCKECGLRFSEKQDMDQHLDWHFEQNKRSKVAEQRATSTQWYEHERDWTQSDGSSAVSVAASGGNFTASAATASAAVGTGAAGGHDGAAAATDGDGSLDAEEKTAMIPSDDSQKVCPVCNEQFEETWSNDDDQWMFIGAKQLDDGRILHVKCAAADAEQPTIILPTAKKETRDQADDAAGEAAAQSLSVPQITYQGPQQHEQQEQQLIYYPAPTAPVKLEPQPVDVDYVDYGNNGGHDQQDDDALPAAVKKKTAAARPKSAVPANLKAKLSIPKRQTKTGASQTVKKVGKIKQLTDDDEIPPSEPPPPQKKRASSRVKKEPATSKRSTRQSSAAAAAVAAGDAVATADPDHVAAGVVTSEEKKEATATPKNAKKPSVAQKRKLRSSSSSPDAKTEKKAKK